MQIKVLENNVLRIECIPALGGKIVSIFHKLSNTELLSKPQKPYKIAKCGDTFSMFNHGGIDECFPNIDSEEIIWNNQKVFLPDHGEIWCQTWQHDDRINSFCGKTKGRLWNYEFEREVFLSDDEILFKYFIQNNESYTIPALWAFHPLFACDRYSKIYLQGCSKVELAHGDIKHGERETVVDFPISSKGVNLAQVRPKSSRTTRKFYVFGKHQSGKASITLNKSKVLVELSFDPKNIPYLGIWINEGGLSNMYNVAIEPSTGYYDKVSIALENRKLTFIRKNESISFQVKMKISKYFSDNLK